jgi:hypothetical protein
MADPVHLPSGLGLEALPFSALVGRAAQEAGVEVVSGHSFTQAMGFLVGKDPGFHQNAGVHGEKVLT